MSEWQPIETCPNATSKEVVWVWGPTLEHPQIRMPDGDFWRYELRNGDSSVPTHWQPVVIPQPPVQS